MAVDPVTISTLPSYLVGRTQTFEAEEKILQARCGLERALDVLAVLDQYADQGRKAGRNSIKDALKNQERPLSEAEVRSVLQVLGELGFVRSTVGRQGTEISALGHQFSNWLSNRSFT
jgi:DNA-binding IclR family transcriptional regulator